jgi:hypothetical protein
MKKITKISAAVAITAAALAMNPAQAHADTVGQVAHEICSRLYANPTVGNLNGIVDELLVRYEEHSENDAMYMAMNEFCPEFQPLAVEAFRQELQQTFVA